MSKPQDRIVQHHFHAGGVTATELDPANLPPSLVGRLFRASTALLAALGSPADDDAAAVGDAIADLDRVIETAWLNYAAPCAVDLDHVREHRAQQAAGEAADRALRSTIGRQRGPRLVATNPQREAPSLPAPQAPTMTPRAT